MKQNSKALIATSGYSYADWRDYFYPADLAKSAMLQFYAQHFSAVELNSTYYKILSRQVIQRLSEKTAEDFEFIVKVHQETTHRRRENELALKQLQDSLLPLKESGKLKGLLAQFPYSFKNNQVNRSYLARTAEQILDTPFFVEFRHSSWLNPALADFLKNLRIGYVKCG